MSNKIVVFRSEGGRYIDMILSVENFDARFYKVASDATFEWNETDREFVEFVMSKLAEAGYRASVVDYETILSDE